MCFLDSLTLRHTSFFFFLHYICRKNSKNIYKDEKEKLIMDKHTSADVGWLQ